MPERDPMGLIERCEDCGCPPGKVLRWKGTPATPRPDCTTCGGTGYKPASLLAAYWGAVEQLSVAVEALVSVAFSDDESPPPDTAALRDRAFRALKAMGPVPRGGQSDA